MRATGDSQRLSQRITTELAAQTRRHARCGLCGAAVLVYLIDERYRGLSAPRIRYVVSSPFGDYTVTGLRPGHYRLATLVGVELGAWHDAEVLREIDDAAVPVSIAATRQTILNLRVPRHRLVHDVKPLEGVRGTSSRPSRRSQRWRARCRRGGPRVSIRRRAA